MAKYMKKPVVIDAWPVRNLLKAASENWAALPVSVNDAYEDGEVIFADDRVHITTLEGTMTGNSDDWIIRGVKGELYPCKPDIFEATYERVAENAPGRAQ